MEIRCKTLIFNVVAMATPMTLLCIHYANITPFVLHAPSTNNLKFTNIKILKNT